MGFSSGSPAWRGAVGSFAAAAVLMVLAVPQVIADVDSGRTGKSAEPATRPASASSPVMTPASSATENSGAATVATTAPMAAGPATSPFSQGEAALPDVVVRGSTQTIPYRVERSRSALFTDTPLLETPFSVSVYDQQLIEDQRAFSLPEVLENDPSVARQMPSGFYNNQNLSLRGFRVDNFLGYRVDGLPITHVVAPYVDDKARVEVLKGPASLQFGFMTPGGAINLVRKRPTQDLRASLQFDVDTFGSLYSQIDVSDTVLNDKLGYRLVLAGDDFDSYYDNAGGHRFMGSLLTEYQLTETVNLWAAISGQDRDRHGYYGPLISGNGNVLDTGVDTNTMQDWARNEQETIDVAAGSDITLNDNWKLRAAVNYQHMARSTAISYAAAIQDNGDFTDTAFLLGDNLQQWDTWGTHFHVEGAFDTGRLRHRMVAGFDYRSLQTRFGDRGFPVLGPNNAYNLIDYPRPEDPTDAWDAYDYDEFGVFLTDTIEVTDWFSTLLGLRYGHIDAANYTRGTLDYDYDDSKLIPTVALMFKPVENVHAYVTYTQGMQDAGLTPFRGVANPSQPLGVQDSQQWEAGVKTELFSRRLFAELAVFQIEQDLAITDPVTNINELNGLQRHRGIEMAVSGRVTNALSAGAAFMLLDAEQVDTGNAASEGKRPQYVPAYQVNLWAVYEVPQIKGLAFTSNVRIVDGQYLDQTEQFRTDDYVVVDVGARYRFSTKHADWTLRLNVENVFDESYYESGEFYPGDSGYLSYGAPVSARFSLQLDF